MDTFSNQELEKKLLKSFLSNSSLLQQTTIKTTDFTNDAFQKAFIIISEQVADSGYIDEDIFKSLSSGKIAEEIVNDIVSCESRGGLHYANEVKRFSNMRRALDFIDKANELIDANDPRCIEKMEEEYHELQCNIDSIRLPMSVEEMEQEYMKHWAELKKGNISIYKTGFDLIDQYICLQPKKLYTLAARSSIGKTALAQQLGVGLSHNGYKTLYFTVEMDYVELCERVLALYSGVSNTRYKYGNVNDDILSKAMQDMRTQQKNFFLQWDPNINLTKIKRTAFDMKSRQGLDVIIVDYLQLLKPHYKMSSSESMHHFISKISSGLKALAGELNCAIIQLSQVSRTQNEKEAPLLNQLKESGSIENDSDAVMILHRATRSSEDGELIIAKNRSGPAMGKIYLGFEPHRTMYFEKPEKDQMLKPLDFFPKTKEIISQQTLDME